jgi:iron complex outermembrane recepter protein
MSRPSPCPCIALTLAAWPLVAWPQAAVPDPTPVQDALDPVVVTGSREPTPRRSLPAAIDTIEAGAIQDAQLRVNISDALLRVPGVVANNRQNYAQDLQVSMRGFGSRATFGVRGVRLIQDGIPLTMPDGQGQTGLFDLDGAQRIEVLRGPLSVLYGNSSGGVIQVVSDLDPGQNYAGSSMWAGEDDSWRTMFEARGDLPDGRGVVAGNLSRFQTDGYREHSRTRRDALNLRARTLLGERSSLTLIVNHLDQPETLDPLGLTAEQLATNRRQAGNNAMAFDTRKSVRHSQAGLAWSFDVSDTQNLRVSAYGGTRQVEQFLAFAGSGATSSGGVVDLDRQFGGMGLEWQGRFGSTLWIAGLDHDMSQEHRQGFVNNNGTAGDTRRDEDNDASNTDARLQARWTPRPGWTVVGGARHSRVRFKIDDHYIEGLNPDDSGSRSFRRNSAMVGLNVEVRPDWHVHASAGRGFETPTLAEIAYRPDGQPGSNLALEPARHDTLEAGVKARPTPDQDAALTWFRTRVRDEIVTSSNVGGRATFANAGQTSRNGWEATWRARWSPRWESTLALTWLDARFDEYLAGGQDFSGNRLPGVPRRSAFAEVLWRWAPAWHLGLEWRAVDSIAANDANTAAAPGYGVSHLRLGYDADHGLWRLRAFARIDNLADKHHVGSVIVNAAGERYYEPAASRRISAGLSLQRHWR